MAQKKSATIAPRRITPSRSRRREEVPGADQQLQQCLQGHHKPRTAVITWTTAHTGTTILAETTYCEVCGKVLLAEPKKEKPRV
jgi:hypothetical protein